MEIKQFLLIVLFLKMSSSQISLIRWQKICEDASQNCESCLQSETYCSWCYQSEYDKPRCNLLSELKQQGCRSEYIFENPGNSSILRSDNKNFNDVTNPENPYESVQIKPQRMKVKLRKGQPLTFQMKYRLAKNYPLDLYYLMDLTYTMEQDLKTMTKLGTKLSTLLQNLTEHYNVAFGYYSDKVAMPFSKMTNSSLINPCRTNVCERPFDFVHRLNFTKNIDQFIKKIQESKTTANLDNLEGAFDALYQVMICQEHINWRLNSRKLIVVATDGIIHTAGDGLLAGSVKKITNQCLLNSDGVYDSLVYDYPSLEEIYRKLLDYKINVLFAAKADAISYYKSLNKIIPEVSYVGELKEKSENVLNLVREGYFNVVKNVKFSANSQNINVKFTSSCNKKVFKNLWNETDTCDNVEEGQEYLFNVTLELENLPNDKMGETIVIEEQNISENLTIEVEYIGKCSCNNSDDQSSESCLNNGVKSCGVCLCSEGWVGDTCSESCSTKDFLTCREIIGNEISTTCHMRGDCECGECICHDGYRGHYCQIKECPKGTNGKECNGELHGICKNGKCICEEEYGGDDCSCLLTTDFCFAPDNTKLCSGFGNCTCGKCECLSSHKGTFCEKCSNCDGLCSTFQECVIAASSETNSEKACNLKNGSKYITNFVDKQITDETKCFTQYTNENNLICRIDFVYDIKSIHTVHINIYQYECIEGPNPMKQASIYGSIIVAAILGLGIMAVMVYKFKIWKQDKIEYEKFQREVQKAKMSNQVNPLYTSPITTYKLPIELQNLNRKDD